MSTLALYSKIEGLPESLKKQVLDYIEFLLSRGSRFVVKRCTFVNKLKLLCSIK